MPVNLESPTVQKSLRFFAERLTTDYQNWQLGGHSSHCIRPDMEKMVQLLLNVAHFGITLLSNIYHSIFQLNECLMLQ